MGLKTDEQVRQMDRAAFEERMTEAMLPKARWSDHWETWQEAVEYAREAIELTDEEKRRVDGIRRYRNGFIESDLEFLLSLLERAGVI